MLNRRSLIGGLLATPAVVRASSLMRVVLSSEERDLRLYYGRIEQMQAAAWFEYEVQRQLMEMLRWTPPHLIAAGHLVAPDSVAFTVSRASIDEIHAAHEFFDMPPKMEST